MAKKMSISFLRNLNTNLKFKVPAVSIILNRKLANKVPCKEITIPVQWGHISAKLWGNEQEKPVLALHGWQDNAGTWDPLAPSLCKERPILAIDLPGHGTSSWIPPGMLYYPWSIPYLILDLKEYFKWDTVSLLSHSMGAIASLRFSCLFPDEVDYYIAIDSLVHDDYNLDEVLNKFPIDLRKVRIDQTRLDVEPPSYTFEQIANIWHQGTKKSVSLESAKILLERGSKQSKADSTKYYFSRDPRLKHILFTTEDKRFMEVLIERLKCPTLYIKANGSPYSADKFAVEMRGVIEGKNPKFEKHFVDGTHHVHLNNPELVAPLIKNFLQKHNLK